MTDGTERTPEEVQREIEQARTSLAATVDQLAERTNPKRLAEDVKRGLVARARSPQGRAVIAGTAAVVVLLVVHRIRTVRRRRS